MKVRKVILTMELMTDEPIKQLKDSIKEYYGEEIEGFSTEVIQVQANVVKEKK